MQPWLKYLRVVICEHTTGNKITIPEYPCRYGHSPSVEELLLFLFEKSQLYSKALESKLEPFRFMMKHFKLSNSGQGLTTFLHARDCHKSLCTLLEGTGVDFETLKIILDIED